MTEINLELSIEVNASIGFVSCARSLLIVHVLSFRNDFVVLFPVLFNEVDTINIVDWHENVFVLLKKLLPHFIFLDLSKPQQF